MARVGYLSPLPAEADASHREAFRQGLQALGYHEGQNLVIEARYADGHFDKLPALAAELVHLKVDVVVAAPSPAVRALQQATKTIPIVMAFSGDPIGDGFVAGLARPGGNITGISATVAEMAAKRVEYLKAAVPRLASVTHLNQTGTTPTVLAETESAGRALGVKVVTTFVRSPDDIDQAFATMARTHAGGVIVNLTLKHHWARILDQALKNRLPTAGGAREFAEAGGLMAYGPHYPEFFRRAAGYVDKILKGARPRDLPVEQATRFQLIVNLRTAAALGLTIPPSLLARTDEIIQ